MKKILTIVIVLILLICGLGFYLNRAYIPVKLNSLIVEGIEENLGCKARLGRVRFNILKGLVLDDLVIFEQGFDETRVFLEVKQVSLGWLFLPLLKKGQIVLPFVNIHSPKIHLRRLADNKFNIPKAIRDKKRKKSKKISFIIYKLNIKNAEINFKDQELSYNKKALLDIELSLSLPEIKYALYGSIENPDGSLARVRSKGEFSFAQEELSSLSSFDNIDTQDLFIYYPNLPFKLAEGRISTLEIEALLKDNLLNISLDSKIPSLNLEKDKIKLLAGLHLLADIVYDINTKELDYSGSLDVDKTFLSNLAYISKVEDLSGKFSFSKDNIQTANLRAKIADSLFFATGTLSDFKNPRLKAKIASDRLDLNGVSRLLAEAGLIDFSLEAEGPVKLALDVDIPVLKPKDIRFKGDLVLENNKLRSQDLEQNIDAISGNIIFSQEGVSWQDLKGTFRNLEYSSLGEVSGFEGPKINFRLTSSEMKVDAIMQWEDSILRMEEVRGKYLNSEFALSGKVSFSEDVIFIDIDSGISLELVDLNSIFFRHGATLGRLTPKGMSNIRLSARGRLDNIKMMEITGLIEAPFISIYGLKFTEVRLSARQKDGLIPDFEFVADSYKSKMRLTGKADLREDDPLFSVSLAIADLDLAQLKLDTPLKDKELSGILNATFNLSGKGSDTANFKGKGGISIEDGNLWEFTPFKKLGQFLVIPSFGKIVFNQAEADLVIEDGYIFTDQLVMKSVQTNLYAYGKMDFKGGLDYTIESEFNSEFARDSSDLMQILSSVVLEGANKFTTLKLTGTIDKPKFKIVPVVFDAFKGLTNIFK